MGPTWGALVWEAYSLGADGVICFAVVPLLTYLYVGGGDAAYQAMLRERESARERASEFVASISLRSRALKCMFGGRSSVRALTRREAIPLQQLKHELSIALN